MSNFSAARPRVTPWLASLLLGAALVSTPTGCSSGTAPIDPTPSDSGSTVADVAPSPSLLELVLPKEIEVQRSFTKPVSFARDGSVDGIEVLLAARDDFGDAAKCVGTVLIELCTALPASSDPQGARVALWTITIDSRERMNEYYDRFARLHRFPVRLESGALVPGKYLLMVTLVRPDGLKLFAEQELTVPAGAAQPGKRR